MGLSDQSRHTGAALSRLPQWEDDGYLSLMINAEEGNPNDSALLPQSWPTDPDQSFSADLLALLDGTSHYY